MSDNKLQQGIDHYHQPRAEGEVDLIATVRQLLIEAGLAQRVSAFFDTNRFIVEAINKNSSAQRFLLNKYWSLQLMASTTPSIEERFCLIPNGTTGDWLRLFSSRLMPFIIANELPVKID